MATDINKTPDRIVLVDSNALVHRAYHAYPPTLTTKSGEPTNAVYGFTKLLLEVIKKFAPKYIVCVFDSPKPTFRHEQFKDYKAHRKPLDQELKIQFPRAREVVEAFNIPLFIQDGYEADDLIGTLARSKIDGGVEKIIVTGDNDILQVVNDSEQVMVYMAGSAFSASKLYKEADVQAKFGFTPPQIIDYKALLGDTSDNIPGVPGIGKKGAEDLIKEFGTVDLVYASIDANDPRWEVQPWKRMYKKLVAGRDSAFMSKELATINLESPVTFTLKDAELADYEPEKIKILFDELDFRSLYDQLPASKNGKLVPPAEKVAAAGVIADLTKQASTTAPQLGIFASAPDPKHLKAKQTRHKNHQIITTTEAALAALAKIAGADKFAFDTETDGLDIVSARILGIGIALSSTQAYFFSEIVLKDQAVKAELQKVFTNALANGFVIAHNLKFDLHILNTYFVGPGTILNQTQNTFDTMVASYVLRGGEDLASKGLKDLALHHLGMQLDTLSDLLGAKKKADIQVVNLDLETLGKYCCDDAIASYGLYEVFDRELSQDKKLGNLFRRMEMPLVGVLLSMEREGIYLNVELLRALGKEAREQLSSLEEAIFSEAGETFNLASPRQVGEILFGKLKIHEASGIPVPKTKTNSYATDERTLRNFSDEAKIAERILTHRELSKLISTYIIALEAQISPITGKIHTDYRQTIASTGRLSSNNPNLQNIPISSDTGRKIRKAFTAGPERRLLAFDYAQQELRLLAHLSEEEKLIKAFNLGVDIHSLTASEILQVPVEQVTPSQRRIGKTVNFGVVYGISGFGLSDRLKIERKKADEFIAKFFNQYPKVRDYFDNLKRNALDHGVIYTLMGRKRDASELASSNFRVRSAVEREIINFPLQGGAADIMKLAMLKVHAYINQPEMRKELDVRLHLQVHDEIIFSYPRSLSEVKVKKLVRDIRNIMSEVVDLKVPMLVDVEVGDNWHDLEKISG